MSPGLSATCMVKNDSTFLLWEENASGTEVGGGLVDKDGRPSVEKLVHPND